MVRVILGILPAINMVAPNSPIARQNANMLPVKIPFHANGTEIVKNMRSSEAPNDVLRPPYYGLQTAMRTAPFDKTKERQ